MPDTRCMDSQVLALLILDDAGERIAVRYHDGRGRLSELRLKGREREFENELMRKSQKQNARSGQLEILVVRELFCLYQNINDVHIALVGDPTESEVALEIVMSCLVKSLELVTGDKVTESNLLKKMEYLGPVLDEIVISGMITQIDPEETVACASMGKLVSDNTHEYNQTFNDAISVARDGILRSIFHGV